MSTEDQRSLRPLAISFLAAGLARFPATILRAVELINDVRSSSMMPEALLQAPMYELYPLSISASSSSRDAFSGNIS